VLFSAAAGLTAYSGSSGALLWQRPGVVLEGDDQLRGTLYVTTAGGELIGLNPVTGARVPGTAARGSSALYNVRGGVALGIDQGGLGAAWGYDLARRRMIWASPPLPWPHYFVDLSGIGGSADPVTGSYLLAYCAQPGGPATGPAGQAGQACLRPELAAVSGGGPVTGRRAPG
jgi:hypothetical protein